MTFEEEFPSLRSKTFDIDWSCQAMDFVNKGDTPKGDFVKRVQVEKHCIDKQRMKEALDSCIKIHGKIAEINLGELKEVLGL